MPFFTSEWTAATGHLNHVERSIYISILCLMWEADQNRIPRDPNWFKRRLRLSDEDMPALESVIAEFCTTTGNWLTQKRLQKEFRYVSEVVEKRKKAARKRWDAEQNVTQGQVEAKKTTDQPNLLETNEVDVSTCIAPTPTPTHTLTERKKGSEYSSSARGASQELEAVLREAAGWTNHPSTALFVTGPIQALIANGADLELDVLPVIRGQAKRISRPNWKYFVPAIAQARDERISAATIVNNPSERHFNGQRPTQAARGKPSRRETFAVIRNTLLDQLDAERRAADTSDGGDGSALGGKTRD